MRVSLPLLGVLLTLGAARASGEAGLTGASTLTRPTSARAVGMAEAFSAVDGGIDSLGYNPAGLAAAKRPQLSTFYTSGLAQDNFGYLGYARPVSFGVVALGGSYYNAGSVHLVLSDGTNDTVTAEEDLVGMASLAVPGPFGLSVGATAKYYRLDLAQQATATGFAGDIGALWHSPLPGLNLGASLQQIGPDTKFEQEGDPLPLTSRFGAAYTIDFDSGTAERPDMELAQFILSADAISAKEQALTEAAGLELTGRIYTGLVSLRLGYAFDSDVDSVSAGVGFKEGRFLIDYALGVKRVLGNTQNVTFGIVF